LTVFLGFGEPASSPEKKIGIGVNIVIGGFILGRLCPPILEGFAPRHFLIDHEPQARWFS